MSNEIDAGFDSKDNEKVILNLIEIMKSVRLQYLKIFIKNNDLMSSATLMRILKKNVRSGDIVKEKNGRTTTYLIKGYKINLGRKSSVDEIVINEIQKLIDDIVESGLLQISADEWEIFHGGRLGRRARRIAEKMDDDRLLLLRRCCSVYHNVEWLASARGLYIPWTWTNRESELLKMYKTTLTEEGEQKIGNNVKDQESGVRDGSWIILSSLDAGPNVNGINVPDLQDWLDYYLNVIDMLTVVKPEKKMASIKVKAKKS